MWAYHEREKEDSLLLPFPWGWECLQAFLKFSLFSREKIDLKQNIEMKQHERDRHNNVKAPHG